MSEAVPVRSWPRRFPMGRAWLCSLLVHGGLAACVIGFIDRIRPEVPAETFRWEVSFVESPQIADVPSSSGSSVESPQERPPHEPLKTASRPRSAGARPIAAPVEPHAELDSPDMPEAEPRREPVPSPREVLERDEPDPQRVAPGLRRSASAERPVQPMPPDSTHPEATASQSVPPDVEQGDGVERFVPALPEQSGSPGAPAEPAPAPFDPPQVNEVASLPSREVSAPPSMDAAPAGPEPETTTAPSASASRPSRRDFGWVARALLDRIHRLRRYPPEARVNGWEGRVLLRAVITDQGELSEVGIEQSSGHSVLDRDAVENLRRAFPLPLPRELGQPHVVLRIPIRYELRR